MRASHDGGFVMPRTSCSDGISWHRANAEASTGCADKWRNKKRCWDRHLNISYNRPMQLCSAYSVCINISHVESVCVGIYIYIYISTSYDCVFGFIELLGSGLWMVSIWLWCRTCISNWDWQARLTKAWATVDSVGDSQNGTTKPAWSSAHQRFPKLQFSGIPYCQTTPYCNAIRFLA